MATQVNIFNHEWCELVFVQRNQSYGAFVIRQNSAKRHLLAMMITLTTFGLGIYLTAFQHKKDLGPPIVLKGNVEFTGFKDRVIERPNVPEIIIRNPNLFRPTYMFVAPFITNDDNVTEADSSIHTMDELLNSDRAISNIEYEGNEKGSIIPTKDILGYTPDNTIHLIVGQMPHYPGGDSEFFKYLGENIKYPTLPRENGVSGTVTLQFVVFATGEIGNIQVLRGFDVSCEKEAVRVIKAMCNWIPGKQNGNAVNVQMCIPVRFSLQER